MSISVVCLFGITLEMEPIRTNISIGPNFRHNLVIGPWTNGADLRHRSIFHSVD